MPFGPHAPPNAAATQVSRSGDLAYTVVTTESDFSQGSDWGKDLRDAIGGDSGGLKVYVTGGLGLFADFTEVFKSVDTKLLTSTVVLVLVGRIGTVPEVAAVTPVVERSIDNRIGSLKVVFEEDPYTAEALETIPTLRDRAGDAAPGVQVLVGDGTATQYDFDHANSRDLRLVVPIALVVIALILGVLLRAVVAPVVLILSVVASFFGTLGLSVPFFRYVVGDPGVDGSLPTFAFILLVALGVDYTIFLVSRVREEAARFGTREGVLRALTASGADDHGARRDRADRRQDLVAVYG